MDLRPIRRALLSVSDKSGLIDLARGLASYGVELISTGGTGKALAEAGLAVRDVASLTGFPEMLDGRVKTLHPMVHGGLLARRDDPAHMKTIADHGIQPIDLVVVNLYPFEATVARAGVTREVVIENIDIGGPSMLRSAAKNYEGVAVLTDPTQYAAVLDELRLYSGSLTLATRERLAAAVFARTAAYDQAISAYFASQHDANELPDVFHLDFPGRRPLRYGENPHQKAAFYSEAAPPPGSIAGAEVLHGKELSFNNLLDLDSALNLVREFTEPAAVVIKHNNPCGAGVGSTMEEAFRKAYEGDPLSAYGRSDRHANHRAESFRRMRDRPWLYRHRFPGTDHAAELEEKRALAANGPVGWPACGSGPAPRGRRFAGTGSRLRRRRFCDGQGCHQADANRCGVCRPAFRLEGVQARQKQRDRAGIEWPSGRRRRGADEPGRLG
jgi:hypothetical protein